MTASKSDLRRCHCEPTESEAGMRNLLFACPFFHDILLAILLIVADALRHGNHIRPLRPAISLHSQKKVGSGYNRARDVPQMIVFPLHAVGQIRNSEFGRNSDSI